MYLKVLLLVISVHLTNNWCQLRSSSLVAQIIKVAYSPDRQFFATISQGEVQLFNAINHLKLAQFGDLPNQATDVDFVQNSSMLAIAYDNSKVQFFNTYTYALQTGFNANHGNGDTYLDFNEDPAEQFLITCGGTNNKVRVWSMPDFLNPELQFNQNGARDCVFDSVNGFAVSYSNSLKYYDDSATQIWSNNYGLCQQVQFGPNLDFIVGACNLGANNKGKVIAYDGSSATDLFSDASIVRTASYAQDGNTMFYGGDANIGYFYDSSNALLFKVTFSADITTSDFSNDGEYLLVATDNGQIFQYSVACLDCLPGYYQNLTTLTCDQCVQFMRACTICINSTFCTSCTQGYYIDTDTHLCLSCQIIQGCSACTSQTVCTFCMPGYYLDSGTCKFCVNAMTGCLRCINGSTCEQCSDDHYLSSTTDKCVSCTTIGGCALCSSISYCSNCQIGYYNTNSGTCVACGTNCLVCKDASNCIECRQGFRPSSLSGGSCVSCGTGCLSCNQTGYCYDCINNMYPSSGSCTDCTFPCDECDDTDCYGCTIGYYLDTGDCYLCDPPCATCNSSVQCLSCSVGYYLTSGSLCKSCQVLQPYCEQCTPTDCLNCTLGYYLNASKLCTPCSKNMYACLSCTSISTCLKCSAGHYLTGSSGNDSCLACPLGCAICSGSSTCQACQPSYYLSTTTCLKCPKGCQSCNSSVCYECEETHYLDTGACKICNTDIQFCLTCDDESGTVQCTSCQIGSYLAGTTCSICGSNCTSCDSSACYSCEHGFYLQLGTCNQCPENCTFCQSATSCSSCSIGYYLATSQDKCLHCYEINCLTCNQSKKCLSCLPGYYLSATFTCELCFESIDNCELCEDDTVCLECSFGYLLAGDSLSCIACSDQVTGCLECSVANQCQVCQNGYFLVTSGVNIHKCQTCPEGCTSCTELVCLTCSPGYVLDTGSCNHCQESIDGCQLCTDISTCIDCVNGYFLNALDSCTLCRSEMKGCQFCNSSSICTYCGMGFYLLGNSCTQCELTMIGCEVCSSGSTCQMCQNGYYLSGTSCTLCQSISAGCETCKNSTHCLLCIQGFYLDTSVPTAAQCNLCQTAIDGCISCDSDSFCNQCEGGYYLKVVDHLCYPCPLKGCQLCYENDSSICHHCNTRYFLDTQQCLYCRDYLQGCIECSNSGACELCQTGYFINSSSLCQLCQQSLEGCGHCGYDNSALLQCIQCKSSYYLDKTTNQCISCFEGMLGCAYCFDNQTCEQCASGYYMNTITEKCISCRQIDGCLVCSDANTCILCKGDYFLEAADNKCYPCAALEGCYSCTDNLTCIVCVGGYLLNDEKTCEVMAVSSGGGIEGMKFQSSYENETTLSHQLMANQMQYNTSLDFTIDEWNNFTQILLQRPDFTLQKLKITDVKYTSKNILKFYTNNPLNISRSDLPTRRLLVTLPDGYKTFCQVSQEKINLILPDLYMSQSLVVDYDLNEPNFVKTFVVDDSSFVFSFFGLFIVVLLTINYIVKAIKTCNKLPSAEHGQLLPHILALKTPAFVLYPMFPEQISYCYGFMAAQFPWATQYFSASIGDKSQVLPQQYEVFYSNMSLASTYLLPFVIYLLCVGGMWLYHMNSKKNFKKKLQAKENEKQFDLEKLSLLPDWPLKSVFYNFFLFGLVFASSASLQNAIYNPIQNITVNAVFTIIGIIALILCVLDAVVSIISSKQHFFKIRILIKSVLLSICHISPLYIFCSTMAIDFILMIIEYKLTSHNKTHPKIWVLTNVICILTLTVLVVLHWHLTTMIVASIMVLIVIGFQVYMHYQQYKQNQKKLRSIFTKGYELNPQNNSKLMDSNVWDIDMNKSSEPRKQPFSDEKKVEVNMEELTLRNKPRFKNKKQIKFTPAVKDDSLQTFSRHQPNEDTFIAGDFM